MGKEWQLDKSSVCNPNDIIKARSIIDESIRWKAYGKLYNEEIWHHLNLLININITKAEIAR